MGCEYFTMQLPLQLTSATCAQAWSACLQSAHTSLLPVPTAVFLSTMQSLDDGSLLARLRALEARRTRAEAELLALRWGIGLGGYKTAPPADSEHVPCVPVKWAAAGACNT